MARREMLAASVLMAGLLSAGCGGDIGSGDDQDATSNTCNGSAALCALPYDKVVFAATHNAHTNSTTKVPGLTNQNKHIRDQLADGVRALMIDVGKKSGEIHACHGGCDAVIPGVGVADWGRFGLFLASIKNFLQSNPSETVTLILEITDGATPADIVKELVSAGVDSRVYSKPKTAAWPALKDLGGKLLVFAPKWDGYSCLDAQTSKYIMRYWDHAFENAYSYSSVSDFSKSSACTVDRGNKDGLFTLNHFLTSKDVLIPDIPSTWFIDAVPSPVKQTNGQSLIDHIEACKKSLGRYPNFVAVDWYDEGSYGGKGSLAKLVAWLNTKGSGVGPATVKTSCP